MDIERLRQDLAEKVKAISRIGKRLKFRLDEAAILIDGSGDTNIVTDRDDEADCTIIMSKET